MFKKLIFGLGLVFWHCFQAQPVWAWGFTGHMIIAQIAYDQLPASQRQEADRLIRYLAPSEPQISEFVPASVWMDAIRWKGWTAFDHWHYQNNPLNPEGLEIHTQDSDHIVWALIEAHKTLANPESGDFQKALMLRALIHMVGDIHQPLHALSRFTSNYPQGDQGGNLFPIKYPGINNLHAFWDGLGGLYPRMNYQDWQVSIPTYAQEIETQFKQNPLEFKRDFDPQLWAQESYALGAKYAYTNISENQPLGAQYIQTTREICIQRMGQAGDRLATVLEKLLTPPTP